MVIRHEQPCANYRRSARDDIYFAMNMACGVPHAIESPIFAYIHLCSSLFTFEPLNHPVVISLNVRKNAVRAVLDFSAVRRSDIIRISAAVLDRIERTETEQTVHPFKLMTRVELAA